MAKGYRKDGIDFDSRFDPDVIGDGPSTPNARSGGTPLKYAHIMYGTKGPDVGYRQGGVDVSNLWAAIGTATYASRGGVPDEVRDSQVVPPTGGGAAASVSYNRNGTVGWTTDSGPGSGTWAPGGSTAGDAYDIAFTALSSPTNGGVLFGTDGVFRQVNASRSASLSITLSGGGSIISSASAKCQIRRRSDNAIVVDFNFLFVATVTSDG
ncbi:MAG TPA: hypothetical protein VJM50_23875 [Pyrinomonadaceae bacterium]|nr:hypothetical protein [Pyrinomonadaceae bacterium]